MGRRHIFLSALILAASPAASPAHAEDPYVIDAVQSMTGGGSFLGKSHENSLLQAEKVVNAAGGIGGRPVHFAIHDDQSSPQTAVQLVTGLIAAHPAVILGTSSVAGCSAMAPLMQNGPVMYCFSPGIHPAPGSYVFTSDVSTKDTSGALLRFFRLKGWRRIATMFSSDATGQDGERSLNEILALPENKELEIVERAHFNNADVSVSAQLERVKAAHPQIFIAWSSGAPIATIFRGIVQTGLDVPVATTNGNMTDAQMTQYAGFLPKELYFPSSLWPVRDHDKLPPAVAARQDAFYRAYQDAGLVADNAGVVSFQPAVLVVDALRKLGTGATATQLRDYLLNLKGVAGIAGIYDFPAIPQRGLGLNDAVVTRWNASSHRWQLVSGPTGVPLK